MNGLVINNKYRIEKKLGEGGMGAVYEAVHIDLGTKVALKQLKEKFSGSRDIMRRFKQEGRDMFSLKHPHIVRVFDYGLEEGFGAYLVMDLVEGEDLGQMIKARGPLAVEEITRIGGEVASALDYAHRERGLVHRDIKPGNILIERTTGRAIVTDFGIAKHTQQWEDETSGVETDTGVFVGTRRYSSPEQIRAQAEELDGRADIYSLGAVFYEMCSGRRFLESMPDNLVMLRVGGFADWKPDLAYPPSVPQSLIDLIDACLERDRDKRIAQASEVCERLKRIRDEGTQPVFALPPPAPAGEFVEGETSITKVERFEVHADLRREVEAILNQLEALRGPAVDAGIQGAGAVEADDLRKRLASVSELEAGDGHERAARELKEIAELAARQHHDLRQRLRQTLDDVHAELANEWKDLAARATDLLSEAQRHGFERILDHFIACVHSEDWERAQVLLAEARQARADVEATVQQLAEREAQGAIDSIRQSFSLPPDFDGDAIEARIATALTDGRYSQARSEATRAIEFLEATARQASSADEITVAMESPSPTMMRPAATPGGIGLPPDQTMVIATPKGRASDMPVALAVINHPDVSCIGTIVPLSHFPYTIGRSPQADFVLDDNGISREHARILAGANAFEVIDLGSQNGTYVNGQRLPANKSLPLSFGDAILLSQWLLRFVAKLPALPDVTGGLLTSRSGRFHLEKCLHKSVKAATYAARDQDLPRSVAIKLLSPTLAAFSNYVDDFRRQAEVAAQLRHPHVCKVTGFGEGVVVVAETEHRFHYLCMDLFDGGDFQQRADELPPPLLDRSLRWLRILADALTKAHNNGIVHGGLKPNCIVFDTDDQPYLADFAAASVKDDSPRRTLTGSPAFLAPEQWDGKAPTAATDQFALAALAYRLLTGELPFEGQENPAVRRRNFERGPLPADETARSSGRTGLNSRVSATLAKAMSVNVEQRYESVGAFVSALEAAVHHAGSRDEPYAFLSYRRDSSGGWVNLFATLLREQHGIQAYLDVEQRDNAVRFPEKLAKAIAECDVFVCFLDAGTLESPLVCEEIRLAHQGGKPMVPVFQQKFRSEDYSDSAPVHIQVLLDYEAVHLIDVKNLYVPNAIEHLAKLIRQTVLK